MSPTFNDIHFEEVTIPHTNKQLPWHGFDDQEYEFISAYRRRFRLPPGVRGRRVFVDFGGVMTAATVFINGHNLGEYRGGFNTFSFELTRYLDWNNQNILAVKVDSTERQDIPPFFKNDRPPFNGEIDYMTFGGIYREVSLRVVAPLFIENVFAKPVNVTQDDRRLDVRLFIGGLEEAVKSDRISLEVELHDGSRTVASKRQPLVPSTAVQEISLTDLRSVELWNITGPRLYDVRARLLSGNTELDRYDTRIGFREAKFTPEGFFLNGRHLKLRGLNRHQTFPYVGQAMPARVQRRDAWILKRDLKCNIVRTSHYPQSPNFLDACDELGLLVFEEIPGWQNLGDEKWKELVVHNVDAMIRRDWNHPSIILWGVRVNESADDHELYTKTNQVAHELDDSRPTGGVRFRYNSERLEDVFTMNDFGFPLRPPNHPLYLNTEFSGHMYPTKRNDNVERITEHTIRHARVHNQLASDNRYAGGLGWCAFDYNTHRNFGSGDRICYHGVCDIFRIPKPAAGFYKSQCDPGEEIVLEPAFDWARGDGNESFTTALVCSNCEHLKIYLGDKLIAELDPDKQNYGHLPHPPFITNLRQALGQGWGDLRLEGYIGGRKVITKTFSGKGIDQQFHLDADDLELSGDGIDATRIVMRVTDEFGSPRPFATGAIVLSIQGPGEIIGENPFALVAGVGAVWVRTRQNAGIIRLTGKHAVLGSRTVEIQVRRAAPSLI